MYEKRIHPPLSRAQFLRRIAWHFLFVQAFVFCSLLLGMAGYEYYEHLAWRDAFLNAAMLLGGMGPVESPQTPGGKIFAGLYALYAGLVFLIVAGVLFAPILHRMMHKFHWQPDKSS
ncbi:MAG: hypothetical protein KGJ08_01065 [Gammaproteobacteria bacterium]|nr:hypothetical protein [Gammaproteobacteria bacterium]